MIVSGLQTIAATTLAVLPVVAFIFGFQLFVIRRPIPNLGRLLAGLAMTVLGLGLFLIGLEQGLFPLGRLMAEQLTDAAHAGGAAGSDWRAYLWVYLFAIFVGFSTTIAEPALLAVAMKANSVSGGAVSVWGLRVAVAVGVAVGVSLGCYRIISGIPLHYFVIAGYVVVVLQTIWAPRLVIPLAYDAGGVTTSTVTVPLIAALGLGLAENVPGRSPLLDGFGLVAFAALFPIISVLAYAQIGSLRDRSRRRSSGRDSQNLKEGD